MCSFSLLCAPSSPVAVCTTCLFHLQSFSAPPPSSQSLSLWGENTEMWNPSSQRKHTSAQAAALILRHFWHVYRNSVNRFLRYKALKNPTDMQLQQPWPLTSKTLSANPWVLKKIPVQCLKDFYPSILIRLHNSRTAEMCWGGIY